jgi:hypothetical protein
MGGCALLQFVEVNLARYPQDLAQDPQDDHRVARLVDADAPGFAQAAPALERGRAKNSVLPTGRSRRP